MSRAFVFPGQGAQTIGMGRALAEAYPAAKAVFDEVDEALGEKLSALIWEGQIEELTLTKNAQPALMATSIAALRALEAEGLRIEDSADFVAGHSLGEYSALCAVGSLQLGDTARLLRIRGQAMQEAVPVGGGLWLPFWGWTSPLPLKLLPRLHRARSVRLPMTMIRRKWWSRAIAGRLSARLRLPKPRAPSARCCCRSAHRSIAV